MSATQATPWPAPITRLSRVDSTSSRLLAMAREGAPEWSVVVADSQTHGRGRFGRAWESPPGNLFLSVLLREAWRPEIPDTLVPLAAGLGVARALPKGACVRLKWPNDLMVGDRKLGGILVEGLVCSGRLEALVIGIGVNLELDHRSLPEALRGRVISVAEATRAAPDREELEARILRQLRAVLEPPRRPERLLAEWRERSVAWWGRRVRVECCGETVEGIAEDLDSSGGLVLALDGGGRRVVLSGEASQSRPAAAPEVS